MHLPNFHLNPVLRAFTIYRQEVRIVQDFHGAFEPKFGDGLSNQARSEAKSLEEWRVRLKLRSNTTGGVTVARS